MELDPVTYEVLRHRLWMINDEQAQVASLVSGSPVVYETKDLSSALMTPGGDGLFVSAHLTRLASCLQDITKCVIERCTENPGVRPGDAFLTNDPWVGAIHQNDVAMVAPIFSGDRLLAWTGIVMHEIDVGGVTPGSLSVGVTDVYGEGPLIPPVRIVEEGVLREDIEALVVRNSRTPAMNSLDIRGRIAGVNRTSRRIQEVVDHYGCDTLLAVEEEIIRRTRAAIERRIAALPDGVWYEEGFLDHDGRTDRMYRLCVSVTKAENRLVFDFAGTDEQASGGVNCAPSGLVGGVVGTLLPWICYDLPWSTGALLPLIQIKSDAGTLNNATFPAGVSHGSVAASRATSHVVLAALSKMCAVTNSGLTRQAEANWTAGWQGMTLEGSWPDGKRFTGITLDQPGGGGARTHSDGIDTGGNPNGPSFGVGNVETHEASYPLLYVYRRQATDSGGAGFYRGGVGTELLVIPHKAAGDIAVNVFAHGAKQPEARGLYGGYPSSVQVRVAFRGSDVKRRYALGEFPTDVFAVECREVEPLAAKQSLRLADGDCLLFVRAGGGGFGDPLQRSPATVAGDVRAGLCSEEVAGGIYGVVLAAGGEADTAGTEARRAAIRAERMGGVAVANGAGGAPRDGDVETELGIIGTAYVLAVDSLGNFLRCRGCGAVLGEGSGDPKRGSVMRERTITVASPWNRFGDVEDVELREFACPSCGRLGAVQVRRRDDPMLFDVSMPHGARARDAAASR
jgi:N-methylhydantoinase B/oxoprolinase/acetone carboxylase alpha subunit